METLLEINKRRVDFLYKLRRSYEKGDFSSIYEFLDENCVFESQWVLEPKNGFDEVHNYFEQKGETLTRNKNYPDGYLVELIGDMNLFGNIGLIYEPGEICLMLEQKINDKLNETLVRVQLKGEKISRIDLCMPELFKVRNFASPVDFFPSNNEENNDNNTIYMNEEYFHGFYLFLGTEDFEFDEYDDLNIPMDKWINALKKWKAFCESETFDIALESLTGLDYYDWSCKYTNALNYLGRCGFGVWNERKNDLSMLKHLIEWTEKYKDKFDYISTYGY